MTEVEELAMKLGEEVARSQEWMKKCELAQKRADAAEERLEDLEAALRPRLAALGDIYEQLRVEISGLRVALATAEQERDEARRRAITISDNASNR